MSPHFKFFLFVYFMLGCSFLNAQNAWTWINPLPSGFEAHDILFVSEQKGFILNQEQLLSTSNQGETWELEEDFGGASMSVFGATMMIAGLHGDIYRSNEDTWTKVDLYNAPFLKIQMVSTDTAYVSSADYLYRSVDGGATWQIISRGGQFFFVTNSTGYRIDAMGAIFKSVDAGETWSAIQQGQWYSGTYFPEIYFVNESVGFAGQINSPPLRTVDGGQTWTAIPIKERVTNFFFSDSNNGYALTYSGNIFKTTDVGATWTSVTFQSENFPLNYLNASFFINQNIGIAVGPNGRIIKTTDGGLNWKPYDLTYATVNDVQITNSNYFIFSDRIYQSSDKGVTWSPVDTGVDNENDFFYTNGLFLDDTIGFATASDGYVSMALKTSDGGKTWSPISIPAEEMSFVDKNNGFAAAENGVFKTTNGGETWSQVSDLLIKHLDFVSENIGFGLNLGYLQKTVDGGVTWSRIYTGYVTEEIADTDFKDESNGLVAGKQGLAKTTDGGATWNYIASGDFRLARLTGNFAFAAAGLGINYISFDGGNSFLSLPSPTNTSYRGESTSSDIISIAVDGDVVLAVGKNGTVLKTLIHRAPYIFTSGTIEPTAVTVKASFYIASNGNNIENLQVHYGTSETSLTTLPLTPSVVSSGTNVKMNLAFENLTPSTNYIFKITGTQDGHSITSSLLGFKTLDLLELEMAYTFYPLAVEASVSGRILSNYKDITNVGFEYDTSANFSNPLFKQAQPSQARALTSVQVSATIDSLRAETIYYCRLKITHDNTFYYSDAINFTTLPEYEIILETADSPVNLEAFVTSHHGNFSNLQFVYGINKSFGSKIDATPSSIFAHQAGSIQAGISVPVSDSIYSYKIIGLYNDKPFESGYSLFRPSGGDILVIDSAENISPTQATIKGIFVSQNFYSSKGAVLTLRFDYGETTEYGLITDADFIKSQSTTKPPQVKAVLENLSPGTEYHYRLRGLTSGGFFELSEDMKFVTPMITEIEDQAVQVEVYPNPIGDAISIKANEPIKTIEVLDTQGSRIDIFQPRVASFFWRTSAYQTGLYYIRVLLPSGWIVKKVIRM